MGEKLNMPIIGVWGRQSNGMTLSLHCVKCARKARRLVVYKHTPRKVQHLICFLAFWIRLQKAG